MSASMSASMSGGTNKSKHLKGRVFTRLKQYDALPTSVQQQATNVAEVLLNPSYQNHVFTSLPRFTVTTMPVVNVPCIKGRVLVETIQTILLDTCKVPSVEKREVAVEIAQALVLKGLFVLFKQNHRQPNGQSLPPVQLHPHQQDQYARTIFFEDSDKVKYHDQLDVTEAIDEEDEEEYEPEELMLWKEHEYYELVAPLEVVGGLTIGAPPPPRKSRESISVWQAIGAGGKKAVSCCGFLDRVKKKMLSFSNAKTTKRYYAVVNKATRMLYVYRHDMARDTRLRVYLPTTKVHYDHTTFANGLAIYDGGRLEETFGFDSKEVQDIWLQALLEAGATYVEKYFIEDDSTRDATAEFYDLTTEGQLEQLDLEEDGNNNNNDDDDDKPRTTALKKVFEGQGYQVLKVPFEPEQEMCNLKETYGLPLRMKFFPDTTSFLFLYQNSAKEKGGATK
jgi:hypothetical protein